MISIKKQSLKGGLTIKQSMNIDRTKEILCKMLGSVI